MIPSGGADRIELRGLRVLGTHGVLAEERHRAQPLELDLDLVTDLGPAGVSDDLADTVDYGAVVAAAAGVVAGPHCDLLEHLAARVADAVLDLGAGRVVEVEVALRKLRPPVPHDLASSGVRIRRRR